MKNISNILRRSKITPLERVTVLVHNDVHREKTGKQVLSDSDHHVLTTAWNASTYEAKEYNKYINIVQLESSMKMDAQMFLYRSELSLLRNQRMLDHFLSYTRRLKHISEQTFTKDIPVDESVHFLTQNTYLRYGSLLHLFTFYNLPKEIRNDLILLDGEITGCEKYMDDQVFLYEQYKDGSLSSNNKNLIVDRIYSRIYYEGAKKIKKSTAEKDGFLLNVFFAELPIKDLFRKIVDDKCTMSGNKDIDTEDGILSLVEECTKNRNISIEKLVKETLFEWLGNGLFVKEYSPIYLSKRFDTWNGKTKKNHKELFKAWYEELQKSKQYFEELFNSKKLNKKTIEKDFLGMIRKIEVITGESLYACKEDVDFVSEYKKQIKILLPISNLFLFIEKNATPIMNYQTLCEFEKLTKNTSTLFDIDMSERYTEFVNLYKEEINLLNLSLARLIDVATEHLYTEESLKYVVDINDECFIFNLNTNDVRKVDEIIEKYTEEFKRLGIN